MLTFMGLTIVLLIGVLFGYIWGKYYSNKFR